MGALIITVLTLSLFFIFNKIFKIYYLGFKGIISTLVGCGVVAYILLKLFEEALHKVGVIIVKYLDKFLLIFPSSKIRASILLGIGIVITLIYVVSANSKNDPTCKMIHNDSSSTKVTESIDQKEDIQ